MANNKVEIEVKANVTGEESVGALGHSLDSTGAAAKKLGTDATGAAGGVGAADSAAKGFTATSGKLRDGLESVSVQLANAKSELLALVGVGAGVQGVKDISALADSYKNLEARIKLTTGEGKAFDTAFAGVFDVAKRTNSAVEETGLLFTKLAEAGKTLGVSQSEALKLTETINQSIQLSGASAEASKASIIQLVQGLQSGVLRGDEFNSIMEQSPRLAKALADGLGVTTGELRKMAEAGQLSSQTVIKALQGQSDAIQAEFGKLPATVGRAMTNLTTAFTAYVGEADKAGGYTAKLAGLIDGLAGNLGTVATVMIHTGQALGAMKLLSMAQDWLAASAAIKATAVSTETATASTIKGTAAKVQNTTATVANTAAQVANAAAWNGVAIGLGGVGPKLEGAGTAAAGAAGKFGLVGTALGGLVRAFAPLAALDIALHFKEYGTAIGEWAARMMGAKDRSAELAAAEKRATEEADANTAARKRQAAATKEAADRTFGLTNEGSALVAKFDEMRTKGDSASDAIGKIGKDFDLSNIPGIRDAAAVLDKLAADGKLSAQEFQDAWATALKGQDLAVFETQARAAFAGTAREAERLAQMLDASLRESIKRTGLDFDVISGGMGKAARSAINDTVAIINGLDRLKEQGVDTAQALTASIGKGINTADSQKAIEAVKLQIEATRKALGDKVADGLLDQAKQKAIELSDALDKAKPGINSLAEAMKELGLKSRESLQATATKGAEAYDLIKAKGQEEGESYLAWQARKSEAAREMLNRMIAANGGVVTEAIKARAAMEGIDLSADKAGKTIVKSMGDAANATGRVGSAAGGAANEFDRMAEAANRAALAAINQRYERPGGSAKPPKPGDSAKNYDPGYGSQYSNPGDPKPRNGDGQTKEEYDRAQGLKGQNAVDNNLQFNIRNKLNAGTLGAGDVDNVSSVIAALKQNAEINKFGRSMGGISLAGIEDDQKWQNLIPVLEAFVASQKSTAGTGTSGSANTVNVRITLPNGMVQTVPTTQDGSAALIAALQSAKLSAGL